MQLKFIKTGIMYKETLTNYNTERCIGFSKLLFSTVVKER